MCQYDLHISQTFPFAFHARIFSSSCFSQNPLHCLCLSKIVYISVFLKFIYFHSPIGKGGKENNNFD